MCFSLGNRKGQVVRSVNLEIVDQSLCEGAKAEGYLEKGPAITKEVGDRKEEAIWYGNLGTVFQRQ